MYMTVWSTILTLQFLVFPFQNDLRFGVEQDVDVVFASFIRKAKDIEDIKKELGDQGKHIWIISKVRTGRYLKSSYFVLPPPNNVLFLTVQN